MSESKNYAIVFPGQGSQSANMLSGWGEDQVIVDQVLNEANEALSYDLGKVIQSDDGQLNQTHITQPAMLTAGVAAWLVWLTHCSNNQVALPSQLAGHSLGEYTALVAAGVLDFSVALKLVEYRGQCMQEAVAEGVGAMAAVLGLDDQQVIDQCAQAQSHGVVEAVNFNAPGQVVIAGEKQAVAAAIDLLKEAGARRAIELPVSVPSHCALMQPAAEKLKKYLLGIEFKAASIPVVHNVNAQTLDNADDMKAILVEQLYKPVRWVDCMQTIAQQSPNFVIESGPGKVLSGLQRRINKSVKCYPLYDAESFETLITV